MAQSIDESFIKDHFERQLVLVADRAGEQSDKSQQQQHKIQPSILQPQTSPKQQPIQQAKKKPQLQTQGKQTKSPPKQQQAPIYYNKSKKFRFKDEEADDCIVPPPFDKLPSDEKEARASMMMSWYMAGYHTGYYDAMMKLKK